LVRKQFFDFLLHLARPCHRLTLDHLCKLFSAGHNYPVPLNLVARLYGYFYDGLVRPLSPVYSRLFYSPSLSFFVDPRTRRLGSVFPCPDQRILDLTSPASPPLLGCDLICLKVVLFTKTLCGRRRVFLPPFAGGPFFTEVCSMRRVREWLPGGCSALAVLEITEFPWRNMTTS